MTVDVRAALITVASVTVLAVAQVSPRASGSDAVGDVLEWCGRWDQVDAVDVAWRLQRNVYSDDVVVESTWFVERTMYRWPDSFTRTVIREDRGEFGAGVGEHLDEDEVWEGIQPDGRHVRRLLGLPHAEVMSGPRLIDALAKEAARAPFLLARWIIEEGLDREDFQATWTDAGTILGVCPSGRLEFTLAPVSDNLAVASLASLSRDGLRLATYQMSRFVSPRGAPGPLGARIDVAVRRSNGQYAPAAPLEFSFMEVIPRPSDSAMTIKLDDVAVQDRRSGAIIGPSGETIAISPTSRAKRSSGAKWTVGAALAVAASLGAVVWLRRRSGSMG